MDAGRAIVEERVTRFEVALAEQELSPAVVALRDHVGTALEAEVVRARAAARGDATAADLAERSLRRLAAALLHVPAVRAREHARDGRHVAYRDGLEAVFGIEVPPAEQDATGRAPRHRAD